MIRTFEETLFPRALRWQYALANVASDALSITNASEELQILFEQNAPRFYPGLERVKPEIRIGVVSLLIPVGCNATCPNICYTDMTNWKASSRHLTFFEIIRLLEQCKWLGVKLVRIIGDGEPTLYQHFSELCQWCRTNGIVLLIFSNGVVLKNAVVEEYKNGGLYVYVKLWSESVEMQNKLVAPRISYHYSDGDVGFAPKAFYQLRDIDQGRVGFQVMISSANNEDALAILRGKKQEVPMLVESFIPQGAGKGRSELLPCSVPLSTKSCEAPPRSSYLAVINSLGRLQAGTFVPEEAVDAKNTVSDVWRSVFTLKKTFFLSRYTGGCFCEAQRIRRVNAISQDP